MRYFWNLVLLLNSIFILGQNSINVYNFAKEPLALMENPAYDLGLKKHYTIPLLGANTFHFASSGFTAYDVFAKNEVGFIDKVQDVVYNLGDKDYVMANQKLGLFNVGRRLANGFYLSFGMYEEADIFMTLPNDFMKIAFEGISTPGKKYYLNNMVLESSLLMTYHVGLQKKIDKKLNVGGRLKLYNALFNISATNLNATYTTIIDSDNTVRHELTNIDMQIVTSGLPIKLGSDNKPVKEEVVIEGTTKPVERFVLLDENGGDIDYNTYTGSGYLLGQVFSSGTKGLGIDVGLTYQLNKNLNIAASLNDLGILFNNRKAQNYHLKGDYITESLALPDDPSDNIHYTDRLLNDFFEQTPLEVSRKAKLRLRPFHVNTFMTYTFNKSRGNDCNYLHLQNYTYKHKVGALLHAQKRPKQILYDASAFYQYNFRNIVEARVSYTINRYNKTNFGFGVSTHLWKIDMFMGVNNIIGYINLAKANNASFQFGLNVIIDKE